MTGSPSMTITRRRFLVGASAALALSGCATPPPPEGEGEGAEPDHPLAGLADLHGAVRSAPVLVGNVTVLDFWASWCGPCRQGFRYLDQLYRTYESDGLKVIAISIDADPAEARRFRNRLRPHFDVGWDPSGEIRDRFRVQGVPTTLLLDREAQLIHRHDGFDTGLHRLLETHVRRLVRGG